MRSTISGVPGEPEGRLDERGDVVECLGERRVGHAVALGILLGEDARHRQPARDLREPGHAGERLAGAVALVRREVAAVEALLGVDHDQHTVGGVDERHRSG